jgi:cytoskeletal protein CcmA (bactofilin family)
MRFFLWILVALVVLAAPVPVFAFTPRVGDTVVFSETLTDDLYIAGGTVDVSGTVDGDVAAAGGTVTFNGRVTGSIMAAGGTLRIAGSVGRTIRAAAGNMVVAASAGGDMLVFGGSVNVEQSAQVGRDLVAGAGMLLVSGTVARNAFLGGGEVTIGGTITGDVEVQAEALTVLPSAKIQGRLKYTTDGAADIQSGAQIGSVERVARPAQPRRFYRPVAFRFAGRVVEALWLLAIGLVALAVAPRGVPRVVERLDRNFGSSLLTGFILLVVVPVAAFVALFTVVGIPLSIAVMLLYLATLYPAQIFTGKWLGDLVLRRLNQSTPSPYLAMTLGIALLVVVAAVPFLGWLVRLAALAAGFGALWAAVWSAREARRHPDAS